MGAILPESKESEILRLLRQDDSKRLQKYIEDNQLTPDLLITNHKRNLIQLSCYYESPKCLSKLIEMNYDYNQVENSTGDTPLFISAKFNNLEMVQILLSIDDCNKLVKNYENLNEFDIAFLKGNYNICYYLLYQYKNDINKNKLDINTNTKEKNKQKNKIEKEDSQYDIHQIYQSYFYNTNFEYDYFLTLQAENKYPLFNMPLFFKCLCNKTMPENCPSFAPERKKTQDLLTKIPDPNETWGHFFKRVATMELYNPPLVDKKNVSVMNSMYMNAQMKLMENEYGIKMGYYKKDQVNDISNEETKHIIDQEDSDVIQIKKKRKTEKSSENSGGSEMKSLKNNDKDNEVNEIIDNDKNEKENRMKYMMKTQRNKIMKMKYMKNNHKNKIMKMKHKKMKMLKIKKIMKNPLPKKVKKEVKGEKKKKEENLLNNLRDLLI